MRNGIIKIDTDRAKEFGLTSDKFEKDSYLWKNNKKIYISFIESKEKNKGYLKELIKTIQDKGFKVAIPTPIGLMQLLLVKWGFKKEIETDGKLGLTYEVWIK